MFAIDLLPTLKPLLFLKQLIFSLASSSERNQLTFKHSSRKLPLNDCPTPSNEFAPVVDLDSLRHHPAQCFAPFHYRDDVDALQILAHLDPDIRD
jgi:hypothetical protein